MNEINTASMQKNYFGCAQYIGMKTMFFKYAMKLLESVPRVPNDPIIM